VFAIVAAFFIGLFVVGYLVTNRNPPPTAYKVGDTARSAGWKVTLFGFKDPLDAPPDHPPDPGDHYVSVDLQITNPSSKDVSFNVHGAFQLLDSANHQYGDTFLVWLDPGEPIGGIDAGQSLRGNVAFEVPDGTTGLRLRVRGDETAAGAVFALSPSGTPPTPSPTSSAPPSSRSLAPPGH
jgi:hypothetical protein